MVSVINRGNQIRISSVAIVGAFFFFTGGAALHAAEITDLTSSFDADDPFDAHVSVEYRRQRYSGAILRESTGGSTESGGGQTRTLSRSQLDFAQTTHFIVPRMEIGIWRDLQLHVAIPIHLSDTRTLSFAQGAGAACNDPRSAACSLVANGFFDAGQISEGQRSAGDTTPPPGGLTLPKRKGIDQIFFGITWAAMSQNRDDTKPTWVLGFEARIAAGSTMRYDRTNPQANTAVGRGVHQLRFWTAVSKRIGFFDPWFAIHYMLPIARSSSLFEQTRFPISGQSQSGPRQMGGVEIGTDVLLWNRSDDKRPLHRHRLVFEIKGEVNAIFSGRGYSPAWEILAGSPNLAGACVADPRADGNNASPAWNNGTYCANGSDTLPYPGISQIQSYLQFKSVMALNLRLSEYIQARLGITLGHNQGHLITAESPGNPSEANGTVSQTSDIEVNPLYRSLIDNTGRRLRVGRTTIFDLFTSIEARF